MSLNFGINEKRFYYVLKLITYSYSYNYVIRYNYNYVVAVAVSYKDYEKTLFWPAFKVPSTNTLVKIYNQYATSVSL